MSQSATGTPGQFGYNTDGSLVVDTNAEKRILALMLGALQALAGGGPSGSPAGGITIATPIGTYTYFHVANSGTLSGGIPVTAKRWTVNFVGTGNANTFGSNTAVTGGQSFSDNAIPSALIAIGCDGSTVADGFYSTT